MNSLKRSLHATGLLLSLAVFTLTIYPQGFTAGTLIRTTAGYVPIEKLKETDMVMCYNRSTRCMHATTARLHTVGSQEVLTLLIHDATVTTALNQQFYLPRKKKWIKASDLKKGSLLLKSSSELAKVNAVYHIKQRVPLFDLEVPSYHNFYVSSCDILVHNFMPEITIELAQEHGQGSPTSSTSIEVATPAEALVYTSKEQKLELKHTDPLLKKNEEDHEKVELENKKDVENTKSTSRENTEL